MKLPLEKDLTKQNLTKNNRTEFDKISPTALLVAFLRQYTDIPYTKELSELVNAQSVVQELLGQGQVANLAILIESRYRAINQLAAIHNSQQIIEIASGLLPRGMIATTDSDLVFIESDLPLMISQKANLVNSLIGERPNLKFFPVDITSTTNQLTDCKQYLSLNKPITFLCEGLLMYLSHPQKQQVCKNVRELLQIYGGTLITSDFVTVAALNRRKQISSELGQISQMVSRLSDRPIGETYFQDSAQIDDFIAAQGFSCDPVAVLDLIRLDQFTCLKPLQINLETAAAILADAYVYCLKILP